MRLATNLAIILVLCAGLFTSVLAIDRDQIHRDQLSGADLSGRRNHQTGRPAQVSASAGTDVRLSESATPAMFTQDHVSLVAISGGDWLAVWHDNREGSDKIWRQRLSSSGVRVGGNTLVAGSSSGADFVDPEIQTDSLGLIYLYYRDQTSGLIIGSRYNGDLTENLAPFVVNDSSNSAFAGPYDVAVFPDGRTVVVWENYGVAGSTVQMRVYNPAGATVAGPTTVHSDAGNSQRWVPSVAVQSGAGYLVAWEDYRNGEADIYARLFTGAGASIGNDFAVVPQPAASSPQYAPTVAFTPLTRYVVGWIDRRQGQEVYLQEFDPVSGLVGSNTLISSGDSLTTNWDLNLAPSPDGSVLASWGASQQTNLIQSRRFGANLSPRGPMLADNDNASGHRWAPAAWFATANQIGVGWTEFTNEDADAQMIVLDTLGNQSFANEVVLNDDSSGSPVSSPSVAPTTAWWRIAVFASRRSDAGDIYLQLFDANGGLSGLNRRVNQDLGANLQSDPTAAAADTQGFIAWIDGRAVNAVSGQRIFGRICTQFGGFPAGEFLISDTSSIAAKLTPRVAIGLSGRALVTWLDNRDGSYQVWGRWWNVGGGGDGSDFRISTVATDTQNDDLGVGVDSTGRFWVSWLDHGTASPSVKAHIYNANKSSVGSFSWTPAGTTIKEISTAVIPAGSLAIVFPSQNGPSRDISLATVTSGGVQVLTPYSISDQPSADPEAPSLCADSWGYLVAVWVDHRDMQSRVYAQAFNSGLVPIGQNQLMTAGAPEFVESPSVLAFRGEAWVTWVDARQYGPGVWGNHFVYEPTDVTVGGDHGLPGAFALMQNYPNPFNPSTMIEFTLPYASEARLEIFNSLGQRVAVLINGPLGAGTHKVAWDGRTDAGMAAASGMYLYRVTAAGSTLQRKMLLVK